MLRIRVEQPGNLGGHAAGGANQSVGVGGQIVGIDAGFVVVAVELGVTANFEQIFIAGHILGQQQQVMAVFILVGVFIGHAATEGGQIGFDSNNRLDPFFFTIAKEFDGSMH